YNNLLPGNSLFGSADQVFPRGLDIFFRPGEQITFDPDGPGGQAVGQSTHYSQTKGAVFDSQPRTISNLIADLTASNPAAEAAFNQTPGSTVVNGTRADGSP
ncbi:hypothetical protein, partial [Nitrosomonas supralitoralis]